MYPTPPPSQSCPRDQGSYTVVTVQNSTADNIVVYP